jgi:hypothetical protein
MHRGAVALLVVVALALVAVVVLALAGVFSPKAKPAPKASASAASAAASPADAPLSAGEEAQLELMARDHADEADAASGFDAMELFAGMASLQGKKGIVTEIVQGLVHEIALACIRAEGVKAPLKVLAVLEMAFQCNDAGEDATGCVTSSMFLALQLGMMWKEKGASRAVAQWFKGAFQGRVVPGAMTSELKATVSAAKAVAELAKTTTKAVERRAVVSVGSRVTASAGRIAGAFKARAAGPVARAAATAAANGGARVAVEVGVIAGARVGGTIAGQLASKALAALGGPVGIAVFVLQAVLAGVAMKLDADCVGDFGEACHATTATNERLTGARGTLRGAFTAAMQAKYGDEVMTVVERASLQPPDFDPDRFRRARNQRKGGVYQRTLSELVGTVTAEAEDTAEGWIDHVYSLRDRKVEQFVEIYRVMRLVAATAEPALDIATALDLCDAAGAGYVYKGGPVAPCRATAGRCCARADAVARLVDAAHARPSACAALKLAVYVMGDAGIAVDAYEALGTVAPTPAAWLAWRPGAFAYFRAMVPPNKQKYADDVLRMSVLLAMADVCGERERVATAADALRVLCACYAEVHRTVYAVEAAECAETVGDAAMYGAWPAHAGGDRAWLHTEPLIMLLSVRWVAEGSAASHGAACAAGGAGTCTPEFAQYAHMHACKYIHAGKSVNETYDPRTYDDARVGHVVHWATGQCTATTAYCEAYQLQPEPVGTSCTTLETAGLIAATGLYLGAFAGAMSVITNPAIDPFSKIGAAKVICAVPRQCESKREACDGSSICACKQRASLAAISTMGLGETITGGLTSSCRKGGGLLGISF